MRKTSCWCNRNPTMRKLASVLVALTPLAGVTAAAAATVVERTVSVTIRGDGKLEHAEHLRVRLDAANDVESWRLYPIYLDENRSLERVDAFVVSPDGRRRNVRRKDRDVMEYSGDSLHSSERYLVLELDGLAVGAEIDVDYVVEIEPYFPAQQIALASGEDVERLEIRISGGGDAFRWRIDGPAEGFEVEENAGGLVVVGRGLETPDPPDYAPGGTAVYPALRFAWGREGSWREVGAWYSELLGQVPRATAPVRAQARELIAGIEEPRQRLEALVAFLRRKVRYVAVQVGIGGYLPTTPVETLDRMWGDCKDKSLLLIDLLATAGIEAYPALILSGADRRIDVEFPAPDQFNHLIVAVPSQAVDYGPEDPVNDGYFFVDPTQEHGTGSWLHPSDQDQDVLVVRDGRGELVRTPTQAAHESRRLVVTLRVLPEGGAVGGAGLELGGRLATGFVEQMASEPKERMEQDARQIFAALLPGVTVGGVGWGEDGDGGVPTVDMSAAVRMDQLLEGSPERRSFKLTGMTSMPEPHWLDEREVPLVLRPQTLEMEWNLVLPDGECLPEAKTRRVENEIGTFVQAVEPGDGGRVKVRRRVEIRHRWIEPEHFEAVRELALAEHRAGRRRIRLRCGEAGG